MNTIYWFRLCEDRLQATVIADTLARMPWALNVVVPVQRADVHKTKKNRYLIVCKV